MMKKLCKGSVISILLVCWIIVTAYAGEARRSITIAILHCTHVLMAFEKFRPLVKYLEQETGLDIKLVIAADPEEFERSLRNEEIDFAFQNPGTYALLDRFYDKGSLLRALSPEGTTTRSGIVIARKDSGIKNVADLKDKTVMFGPKFSTVRWIAAKWLFEDNGLDIDRDLRGYSNGKCCEDIAFSVQLGKVDAGVVCDHFLEQHCEKHQELGVDPQQLAVIGKTKLVSTRVFASRQGVDSDIVNKVNEALLRLDRNLPEHDEILNPTELGGFQKSKDEYYDDIRSQLGIKIRE